MEFANAYCFQGEHDWEALVEIFEPEEKGAQEDEYVEVASDSDDSDVSGSESSGISGCTDC
ncbi:UNVERIFIED_CONTAM: hypothetical protein Sradi_4099900 [Sesamum radiatum]|uniref:Uncharacterized protein n=1 Tax=Sesamum radiatum TaxID=300843 RepID=A0AAW2P0U7_SESRA